eukprot:CAMPEP_0174723350 /NCGR_PEP_ID=MMETSP1094-20130205/40713_1 /TAXON_ID=156173 /ORGANISM="Chrysochromulina brevifilum, Strain UTEX LB 985" /LENGTH=48 /DNA_ID= /DNA_START= /DNA_END= /DNA_ORIENTATION=
MPVPWHLWACVAGACRWGRSLVLLMLAMLKLTAARLLAAAMVALLWVL